MNSKPTKTIAKTPVAEPEDYDIKLGRIIKSKAVVVKKRTIYIPHEWEELGNAMDTVKGNPRWWWRSDRHLILELLKLRDELEEQTQKQEKDFRKTCTVLRSTKSKLNFHYLQYKVANYVCFIDWIRMTTETTMRTSLCFQSTVSSFWLIPLLSL
jgi:hypothetical protein